MSSFFNAVVVVFILFLFYNLKKISFFNIANSFLRKKAYLLTYLSEAEKQLSDSDTYNEVKLSEKKQVKLAEKSNSIDCIV